ncbi:hypothetical protein TBR22_A14780 [Luteitalea sp. TBR-22]|uniref:hypothetical protein n=1 Tax=Luteitalea sp. TBR-22 TaxID=2802971 RepID=UPI001AF9985C|nr:hypothetical protein [Luteitalea sp. TBR-22]BCS32268.1 hypothetical protein TBR22_A14780 [Luteitalea sp. TBR-22]
MVPSLSTRRGLRAATRLLVPALCVLGATAPTLHAEAVSRYRGFALGSAVADVLTLTRARPADVKTIHDRPALIQQLEWHTPYASSGEAVDPVKTITFGFVDGRLYQMTVDYDRVRVGGLTTPDLIAGVEAVYGAAAATTRPQLPIGSAAGTTVLGHWADPDATMTLVRGPYEDLRLVVRSIALGADAQRGTAAAISQDATEAPARRAAARTAEAAALQDERAKNKSAFKP